MSEIKEVEKRKEKQKGREGSRDWRGLMSEKGGRE
jgi:hypothetical protein